MAEGTITLLRILQHQDITSLQRLQQKEFGVYLEHREKETREAQKAQEKEEERKAKYTQVKLKTKH